MDSGSSSGSDGIFTHLSTDYQRSPDPINYDSSTDECETTHNFKSRIIETIQLFNRAEESHLGGSDFAVPSMSAAKNEGMDSDTSSTHDSMPGLITYDSSNDSDICAHDEDCESSIRELPVKVSNNRIVDTSTTHDRPDRPDRPDGPDTCIFYPESAVQETNDEIEIEEISPARLEAGLANSSSSSHQLRSHRRNPERVFTARTGGCWDQFRETMTRASICLEQLGRHMLYMSCCGCNVQEHVHHA